MGQGVRQAYHHEAPHNRWAGGNNGLPPRVAGMGKGGGGAGRCYKRCWGKRRYRRQQYKGTFMTTMRNNVHDHHHHEMTVQVAGARHEPSRTNTIHEDQVRRPQMCNRQK